MDIVYSHTGYDVIIYFPSEVIAKQTVENTTFDGFGRNFLRTVRARITKFGIFLENNLPHNHAEYNITSSFWSAFIELRKTAENAASDGFVCIKSNAVSKASSNFLR